MIAVDVITILAVGYLLGSIPFGLILTRLAGLGDIRNIGSGNIGATNVLRTGNKKLAALTLILDGLKGALAVIVAGYLSPELDYLAALGALLGHIFPIWLKFKGGKGVATFIGAITVLIWPVGVMTMIIWMIVVKLSRYSSLAALIAIGIAPLALFLFDAAGFFWLVLMMTALIFWKHRANIGRLLKGTEPKIGASAPATLLAE
jgi:glycerol-3-phosphate acyltransferase PlsY